MNDNVIKFPRKFKGKKVPKIVDLDASRLQEDLDFCDGLAEGLMITLIHNIGENGFNIKSDRFIGDISFLNEVVKGALYRQMGFNHPMQDFMSHVVKTEKKDSEVLARIDLERIDDMTSQSKNDNGNGDDTS